MPTTVEVSMLAGCKCCRQEVDLLVTVTILSLPTCPTSMYEEPETGEFEIKSVQLDQKDPGSDLQLSDWEDQLDQIDLDDAVWQKVLEDGHNDV